MHHTHTHTHTHTAYEVLSDPKKRQQYDQFGAENSGGTPNQDFHDFNFNYDSFFSTDHFNSEHSHFNTHFKFNFDDVFNEFFDESDPFGGFGFDNHFGGGGGGRGGGGHEVDDGFGFGGMFDGFGDMFGDNFAGQEGDLYG